MGAWWQRRRRWGWQLHTAPGGSTGVAAAGSRPSVMLTYTAAANTTPSGGSSGGDSTGTGSGGGGVLGSPGGGGGLGSQTALVSSGPDRGTACRATHTIRRKQRRSRRCSRAGGFAVALKVLEAGTAVIDWYEVPAGARACQERPSQSRCSSGLVSARSLPLGPRPSRSSSPPPGRSCSSTQRSQAERERAPSRPPPSHLSPPSRRSCSSGSAPYGRGDGQKAFAARFE